MTRRFADMGAVRTYMGLAGIAGAALAIRAISWQRTGVMFNDGPVFIGLARLIADGEWSAALAHPFHPLYPAAIAASHFFFDRWDSAAVAVSAVTGALCPVVLFFFLRSAFCTRVAWIGALLLAVHPYAVEFSADTQSEGLYVMLFIASVAQLWNAYRKQQLVSAATAGMLAGLAYLVRPEGLGVVAVGTSFAVLLLVSGRWTLSRTTAWSAMLVGGALLMVAPYVLALHAQTGNWALTQKKSASLAVVAAPSSPLRSEAIAAQPFLEAVVRGSRESAPAPASAGVAPISTAARVADASFELAKVFSSAMRPEMFALAGIGLMAGLRRRWSREAWIALFTGVYLALLFALILQSGYVSRRHALPVAILLLGYAAAGVPIVGSWLVVTVRWALRMAVPAPVPRGWAVCAGLALVAAFTAPSTFEARRTERIAERLAAEWLGAQPEAAGAPVAAAKQRVAYYAGGPHVRLPDPSAVDALVSLRDAGARFLVVDDHYLEENPALRRATRSGMPALHRARFSGHSATVFSVTAREGALSPPFTLLNTLANRSN